MVTTINLRETFGVQLRANDETDEYEGEGSIVVHNGDEKYTLKFNATICINKHNRRECSVGVKLVGCGNSVLDFCSLNFCHGEQAGAGGITALELLQP